MEPNKLEKYEEKTAFLRSVLRKNVYKPCSGPKKWFSVNIGQTPNFWGFICFCALPANGPCKPLPPPSVHRVALYTYIYSVCVPRS